MPIDWNNVIIETDDDTVYAECGKSIIFTVDGGSGGGGGGDVNWGDIGGQINNQTDLKDKLDAKIDDAPSDDISYVRKHGEWVDIGLEIDERTTKETQNTGIGYTAVFQTAPKYTGLEFALSYFQEGTGTPSAGNRRPIHGSTAIKANISVDNMIVYEETPGTSIQTEYGITIQYNSDGSISYHGTSTANGFLYEFARIKLTCNTSYYLKYNISDWAQTANEPDHWARIIYQDSSEQRITDDITFEGVTFGTQNKGREAEIRLYLQFYSRDGEVSGTIRPVLVPNIVNDKTFAIGNTSTYNIAFDHEVAAGTLDLETGKLTETAGFIQSYNGESLPGEWVSDRDVYTEGGTPTTGAQVLYYLASPVVTNITPQTVQLDKRNIVSIFDGYTPQVSSWISGKVEIKDYIDTQVATKIDDAPQDGSTYGRTNGEWTHIKSGAPEDGQTYGQRNGEWKNLKTGYLIYVSTNGDDSNPGTSSAPLKTITKALTLCAPNTANNAIYISAGTYNESLFIDKVNVVMFANGGNVTITGAVQLTQSFVQLDGVGNNPAFAFENGLELYNDSVITDNNVSSIGITKSGYFGLVADQSHVTFKITTVTINAPYGCVCATNTAKIYIYRGLYTGNGAAFTAEKGGIIAYGYKQSGSTATRENTTEGGRIFSGSQPEEYTKSEIDNLLNDKQDTLTFDSLPTSGSQNPVRSGGVYTALGSKANTSQIAACTVTSGFTTVLAAVISYREARGYPLSITKTGASAYTDLPGNDNTLEWCAIYYGANTHGTVLLTLYPSANIEKVYFRCISGSAWSGDWAEIGGADDAPSDNKAYGRLNGAWSTNTTSYGYCQTAAETAAKTVTIPGFSLVTGATIFVKFQYTNSASNPTLNVNGTGAKALYRYGTTRKSTTAGTWQAGAVLCLTYDGTGWIETYWNNNTYTIPGAYCTTEAGTAAKAASCTYYSLKPGYFEITMRYANTAQSALTLNIASTGALPIYINGVISSSTNYSLPGGVYIVYCDGTKYYFRTDGKIEGIQDTLTFDTTPTAGSTNPVTSGGIKTALDAKADTNHNHDTKYAALGHNHDTAYSALGHTHDDRYYTETEVDTLLAGKSDTSHTHDERYYTESETDTLLAGKSDTNHTHDDRYYTESEVDTALNAKANSASPSFTGTPTIDNPSAWVSALNLSNGGSVISSALSSSYDNHIYYQKFGNVVSIYIFNGYLNTALTDNYVLLGTIPEAYRPKNGHYRVGQVLFNISSYQAGNLFITPTGDVRLYKCGNASIATNFSIFATATYIV